MPGFPDIISGFKLLRDLDLNKIREQADSQFQVVVIGQEGVGKSTLIQQMRANQNSGEIPNLNIVHEYQLDEDIIFEPYGAAILLLDATSSDNTSEIKVFEKLRTLNIPTLVCLNKCDLLTNRQVINHDTYRWPGAITITISAINRDSLLSDLVPAMIRMCKGKEIPLARRLPLFREFVSRRLIEDACFINATYSLGTGLVEIVPFLTLPLNAADMVILTKNQAFMAYQISLALGLSADYRQTIPKLAAVVGSGFLWRQIARQLVGLVPGFGIVSKVAVSYAGTYAVGQAIYRWCSHGEKLNSAALKLLYKEALGRGKEVAQSLLQKRRSLALKAASISNNRTSSGATCLSCQQETLKGALFCAFCGKPVVL